MMRPAFVVGVGTSILSLVRALGRQGVPCWTCCTRRIPGTVSSYARFWRVPDPQYDERGLIARIIELAGRVEGRPIVFVAGDHFSQALARHRDRLETVATVCVASRELVDLLIHKRHFSDWAREQVASFPKSTPATAFAPDGPLAFPVVAKPFHRGFSNARALDLPSEKELHDLRFTLIEDAAGWDRYRRAHARLLPHILIQRYIRGTSASKFSVGIYASRDSEIKGVFVGRRVRGYPALYGDASLVESSRVPDPVLAEVADIVRRLGYAGIAEFEYNQDAETGEFHLLEINPRSWGWIGITTATDANIPWIAYRDLAGEALPGVVHCGRPGATKMVLLVRDLANAFLRYRWNRPDWVLSPRAWRRSLEAENLVVWEFDRDDLRGSLWCLLVVLHASASYVRRGLTRNLAARLGRIGLRLKWLGPQQAD